MTDSLAFCEEIEEICASILAIIIGILAAIFASDIVYKILLLLIAATLFSLGSHRYFLDAKTLIISKSGIYTEFWLYKRFYKWSDFKYIGMRNCRRYYPRKNSDWKELIFYTKKAQNPVKSDDKSCASLHPFSLYIYHFLLG